MVLKKSYLHNFSENKKNNWKQVKKIKFEFYYIGKIPNGQIFSEHYIYMYAYNYFNFNLIWKYYCEWLPYN